MIDIVNGILDHEQVGRIPDMGFQKIRHLCYGLEQCRIDPAEGLHQRIGRVDHIVGYAAIIGIDHYLYRIADIVYASFGKILPYRLRIREHICGSIGIMYPVNLPVFTQHQIRVPVIHQERSNFLIPLGDHTMEHNPAVAFYITGYQYFNIRKIPCENNPPQHILQLHSARALIRCINILVPFRIIKLFHRCTGDHILIHFFPVIYLRHFDL